MKRRSCLLLGSLLLSGVLLSGCGKDEAPPESVRPVVFVEVRPESNQDFGRFAGNIQARYQSVLGFRVAGRIARRDVDVGAEVKKGDLLATLDPTDQQNTVRARQGDLANVQAQLINAQANARRQQELFDRGVGAQAQLDIALTDLKTASSSQEQAKAAAQQARDQLSYSELRSDHDAVVTEWKVEAGQVVTAGQEVVTLARPDIKEAVIDLPDTLADQLPSDVVFTVASQLNPEVNTTATIREIEPQADRTTRTRRARLSLAQTPAAFRLGTAISVTLSSTITPRMRLPINALQEVDGKRQVWIVDSQSQTVNPRAVIIASRDSDSFVLTDGVKAGEKVVSAGVNSLKPGQKVKVDEESPR
ncbi:efflux RND transporter periplasmic adaptor subunit [Pseudomonas syringae]|uniref:Secretion protein HlyD n=1 Tax=Pseudomonas syringae pv. aceris TaxID=199198 RepID=A0A0L8IUK3_PSESX|nr:efflux RND transporter periplasmic adaptor subunit [Pseudomonas syringae]EGH71865.1 secretion protein HlyD [Pseudomonas syringae pv. aceris str. M302273]KOG04849.1 Secretion protein HlyD [Pseudomonas syringae pv. aceris]KPW12736.1 Secretion protein HlyD [Pseudomonas syringae pv. aceris]